MVFLLNAALLLSATAFVNVCAVDLIGYIGSKNCGPLSRNHVAWINVKPSRCASYKGITSFKWEHMPESEVLTFYGQTPGCDQSFLTSKKHGAFCLEGHGRQVSGTAYIKSKNKRDESMESLEAVLPNEAVVDNHTFRINYDVPQKYTNAIMEAAYNGTAYEDMDHTLYQFSIPS